MKKTFASVLIFFWILPTWASEWEPQLKRLLASQKLPENQYGVMIAELQSGKVLFAQGENLSFNPASTMKVLVTAAALSKFGPDYHFTTEVARSGKDLCLIGKGDPSLVQEAVWQLVEEVQRQGVRVLEGNLIVDDSFLPTEQIYGEEFFEDSDRAFFAPISALSVNYNSLTLVAQPTQLHLSPQIQIIPSLPWFRLSNRARTVSEAVRGDLVASLQFEKDQMLVSAGGRVGLNRKNTTIYRAVSHPALYVGNLFSTYFQQTGGVFHGKILHTQCPASAEKIFSFPSKPLSQIIFGMNKFSNNFIAEMLLRLLGNPPSKEKGIQTLQEWLNQNGILAPELILENGSGLSRQNRISANTLATIVRKAVNNLSIGPEFLSSFGLSGSEGTLRRRFKNIPQEGLVRAKSGSLRGVVSLTGIIKTPQLPNLVFAFLFNVPSKPNWVLQKLEEDMIALLQSPPKNR